MGFWQNNLAVLAALTFVLYVQMHIKVKITTSIKPFLSRLREDNGLFYTCV